MKRFFLSLFIFTITITSVEAQDLNYGAKAGLNIAGISFSSSDYSTSPRIGFLVGGFLNYKIKEKLSVQPEVFYSTGGNNWDFNDGATTGEIKTSLISLPVLLKYNITNGLFLEAGLQYNFLLSIEQKIEESGNGFEDLTEFYKSGTLGFAIGASYQLDMVTNGLAAGLRFTSDFSKLNDVDVDADSLKQYALQLTLLYTFLQ
ncbi:porin family protein [Winogradskyella ursingii]|uniref:porin family protein n=1 Tax=Winogradskyella ursingii TaxID=2686079 RepID=UPI0015C76A0C|nr:porin family protein [Winogradskyella ursingii]